MPPGRWMPPRTRAKMSSSPRVGAIDAANLQSKPLTMPGIFQINIKLPHEPFEMQMTVRAPI